MIGPRARLAALCGCLLLSACSRQLATNAPAEMCARPADRVIVLSDAHYGSHAKESLDFYLPWHRAGEPLILLVHGGGWTGGDKNSYGHIGRYFAGCGIAVANVDYPLAPAARAHDQAAAILRAARWLASHGAVYRYAGDRIFLMGHSAGAEIVTLAALDKQLAPMRRGLTVAGVIAMSGLGYDPPRAAEAPALPAYIANFYRAAFGPDTSRWQRFDVVRQLNGHAPPFLIVHGRNDMFAPEADSNVLANGLRRFGDPVAYLQPDARDHNSVLADAARDSHDQVGLAIERFVFSGSL